MVTTKESWITRRKNGNDKPWNKGLKTGYNKKQADAIRGRPSWNKGKKLSKEHIEKLKLAKLNYIPWNKGLKTGYNKKQAEKMRGKIAWNKGKHFKTNNALEIWRLNGGKPPHTGKKRPEITGEKNNMWKGGITPERNKIRSSPEYRIWKYAVFSKDNFTCQKCKKRGGNLNAHHIKSFAKFPELRFAIDNGQTLCKKCHCELHKLT